MLSGVLFSPSYWTQNNGVNGVRCGVRCGVRLQRGRAGFIRPVFFMSGSRCKLSENLSFSGNEKQEAALPGHYSKATAVPIGKASRSRRRDWGKDHADPEGLQASDGVGQRKAAERCSPLPQIILLYAL